jgi:hypothetical protein
MATERITTPGTPDDGRALLERFPNARRSYLANTFLYAVRAGAHTPARVLADVEHELREVAARSQHWGFSDTIERTNEVAAVLSAHRGEALAFAAWCIAYQALPPAEKERQKRAKREVHRQVYMEMQPATEKQIAYIRALGYHGVVTSKAMASSLIDKIRRGELEEVQR